MSKVNYSTPNTSSWSERADDLFLAQFRGLPCEICGKTHSTVNGVKIRSCGHHKISKELCRAHRYNRRNIIVLCPLHHTRFTGHMSPHSKNSVEIGLFYEWLIINRPNEWKWVKCHYEDSAGDCLTYKDAYIRLGGEITNEKFKKDQKPLNHSEKITITESKNK